MMNRVLDVSYTSLMEYGEAWEIQKNLVKRIDEGELQERLMLLQHPPTYTMGSKRHPEHLLLSSQELKERGISVFQIDRGGDITYHGPGQLVGYPLLVLEAGEKLNLHGFLRNMEEVFIQYLSDYGITAGRKDEYTGVWVGDHKICAIGVKFNKSRLQRAFITSHGFALNVKKGIEREGFDGIVPCGISEFGVTSLEECAGRTFEVEEVAREIIPYFTRVFPYKVRSLTK